MTREKVHIKFSLALRYLHAYEMFSNLETWLINLSSFLSIMDQGVRHRMSGFCTTMSSVLAFVSSSPTLNFIPQRHFIYPRPCFSPNLQLLSLRDPDIPPPRQAYMPKLGCVSRFSEDMIWKPILLIHVKVVSIAWKSSEILHWGHGLLSTVLRGGMP